jgi:hypothetical protein
MCTYENTKIHMHVILPTDKYITEKETESFALLGKRNNVGTILFPGDGCCDK